MKTFVLALLSISLFSAKAQGGLAYSILEKGHKSYDTSLELTKSCTDYLLIISEDLVSWEYLKESEGLSCGRCYASLALKGRSRTIHFSLARRPPLHYLAKRVVNVRPLTDPVSRFIKARSTNFMTVSCKKKNGASVSSAPNLPSGSISFHLLTDGDEDGLPDMTEFEKHGAWPGLYDTDQDGLSDGEEVALGFKPYLADSDGDGIADSIDPHPLVPEYELIYSAWVSHWNAVAQTFQTAIPQDRLTKAKFSVKQNPFYDRVGVTAKFSPDSLTLTNGRSATNVFEVTFLSANVVTGLIYAADCFSLDYDLAQFLPDSGFPSAPEGCAGLPFLARPGETLRFKLVSDQDREETGSVMVRTADGPLQASLAIGYRNALPPRPELLSPTNGAEYSGPFDFAWTCSDETVTNYLLTITGPAFYEYSLPGNSLRFTPEFKGRYSFLVTAFGENGPASSGTRSFFILDPEEEKDSDGDGFSDNCELREGFDPSDGTDAPMRLETAVLPTGEKGLFYFRQLIVSGGARPLFFKMNCAAKNGLSVSENGLLYGIPIRSGSFTLSLEASDQSGRVLKCSLPLNISEKTSLDVFPGLGGFLVK